MCYLTYQAYVDIFMLAVSIEMVQWFLFLIPGHDICEKKSKFIDIKTWVSPCHYECY